MSLRLISSLALLVKNGSSDMKSKQINQMNVHKSCSIPSLANTGRAPIFSRQLVLICRSSRSVLLYNPQIHKLYLTNYHSSQEHATYGTSYLPLPLANPTTCLPSNSSSVNLILSLSPLSFSRSSFFHCWSFVGGHHGLSPT